MRVILSAVIAVALCVFAEAQTPEYRAKAAIALSAAQRERDAVCKPGMKCCDVAKATVALAKAKRERENSCTSDLAAAIERADRERRPLFVWVGMTCTASPEIRKSFPAAVHCHADSLNGNATPRLLVMPPNAKLAQGFAKTTFSPATVGQIRGVLGIPASTPRLVLPADCGT